MQRRAASSLPADVCWSSFCLIFVEFLVVALGFSTATAQVVPTVESETTSLQPGKAVERNLTGAEIHRYRLKLQKGDCAAIQVEQHGIDVVVQLLGGDNDTGIEVDDQIGKHGTETLEIVAENDGTYTVAIKTTAKLATGAYEIRLAEVRPAASRDRSLYEVEILRTKAQHLFEADKRQDALPVAERALALAQKAFATDDAFVGLLTEELAEITYSNRRREEARQLFERAFQLLTAALGPDHPQTILAKSRLGFIYEDLEDYSRAEQLLSQALEAGERMLGRDDPLLAETLAGLANLHMDRDDYAAADREFHRGLGILEGVGLTEARLYSLLLNSLGILYVKEQDYDRAGMYFQRVLAFREKKIGPESLGVSIVLNNLGIVARRKNDYPAAERYYSSALSIIEKNLGPEHPDYARALTNLANVYGSEGNYERALDTHLRALHVLEKTGPEDSRRLALERVSMTYAAMGDLENANKFQSQFQSALERDIALNVAFGSERQKLLYVWSHFNADYTDEAVSLNLQLEPDNSQAAVLAANVLLQRKGRIFDAVTDTLGALRKRSEPQDQILIDQLKEATTQLARLAFQGPQKGALEEHRKALQELQEERETLESLISRRNQEFRSQSQPVTLEAVLAAIPADCALVEFVAYRPLDLKPHSNAGDFGDLRYAAYVLQHNITPKAIDLGDAKAIDALVDKLRVALRDPSRSDAQQMARAVSEKVFQPLQHFVASDSRLLISPDAQLNLIPFEALLDDSGHYLVERFSISYLTTGRDLLRMQVPRLSKSAPAVVADPFFGEPMGTLVATGAGPQTKSAHASTARRSVTAGTDFSGLYFAPLVGTRTEAESIHALFPDAQILTGERASEAELEQLSGPKFLHIATHGFFLQDASQSPDTRGGRSGAGSVTTAEFENPLLRSGLALSGANLVRDSRGGGILTALQASNLNLWGTKLVTLSACDTGVGEVKNGEGVYGLRRSFFLAGAETLVISLWPVSDYLTREMMHSYYSGLKKGLGRGEALRQTKLAMLKRRGRQHPFYWASFIQAGEWANLDGQR